MRTWEIRTTSSRNYVIPEGEMAAVRRLIEGVQGTITIESVSWNGDCTISIHGCMTTDSRRVAKRVASLIHSIGGRARLREIDDRKLIRGGFLSSANRQRKTGGYRRVTAR